MIALYQFWQEPNECTIAFHIFMHFLKINWQFLNLSSIKKTAAKVPWLHWLLQDIGVDYSISTPIYCDNQSAIHIAHNDIFHKSTKYIEIDRHFIHYHLLQSTLCYG